MVSGLPSRLISLFRSGVMATRAEQTGSTHDSSSQQPNDMQNTSIIDDGEIPLEKIASVNDSSSIPNGGLRAWLVVGGSFLLFLNSWYD